MQRPDEQIEKLLRAARLGEPEPAMPFGFDTRVVALARNGSTRNGSARLLQRVAAFAGIVTIAAGAAAWWQISAADSSDGAIYAIADTAIDGVLE